MKINWRVRFKSPVFVTAFASTVLTFVYTLLGLFGIVPAVSEDAAKSVMLLIVELLGMLGILTDPTSKGISDSADVLRQTELK